MKNPMNNLMRIAVGVAAAVMSSTALAVEDVSVKINDVAGTNSFVIQNAGGTNVVTIDSRGAIMSGTNAQAGKLILSDGDATAQTVTITTPNISGNYTLKLPTSAGTTNQFLQTDGAGTLRWASPYTLVATLAGDVSTAADTNAVSLTGLVFTYEANSIYLIRFMGRVSSAVATTGCGFQFDLSTAVTDINVLFYHQLANAGTTTGGNSIFDDASVGVSSGVPVAGGLYPVYGTAILRPGANTGTAQLRFRSEVAAVTTAKAGLTMVVEKVN